MRTRFSAAMIGIALQILITLPLSAQDREIKDVADTLSRSLSKAPKRTVAVVDFTDLQGNVTQLGRYVAEELENSLVNADSGVDLVDRTRLKSILLEHKLASTGIIDPATVQQFGKISGVEVIITGTLTPLGDSVRFSIKALDTADARIVTATSGNIAKTPAIVELLNQGIASEQTKTSGSTFPGPGIPPSKSVQIVEAQQISFALQSCELSGNSITCHLTVTNRGR